MRRFLASLLVGLTLVAGGFSLFSPSVHAQVDTGLGAVGQTVKLSSADPRVIATNIINIALGLVGIILVSLLVYAGFVWMTAGGDEEKVSRAKRIITSAIIGLIIVLSSWAIARFVIERLLQATQNGTGGGTTQAGGGGLGGGFGSGGASNVFQVKSITPQGNVSLRNVQVKVIFSRPIDENTASAILVTKNGGTAVAGSLSVSKNIVVFIPSDPCPAPNGSLFCFDADSDYTIQVGPSLRSIQGQSIVCGGFAPACSATFHTGSLIDTQNPTASVIEPLDGQAVPADSLVTIRATASDDSGISYIEFADNGTTIDQSAPSGNVSQTSFTGDVLWDTAGIPLQSIRQLTARAFDLDAHDAQSSPISVIVRAPSCFNGVKDGDETDVDCGGTPNTPGYCGACAGGSCSSNAQCSSSACQNGSCVVQPTMTNVSPQDGQPDTFVTIQGLNFGTSGVVRFLGAPGPADDVIAVAPSACSALGTAWSPTQVIVAVPAGAVSGPIEITNGQSGLKDATSDARGPQLPDFLVNTTPHPGLCGVNPNEGMVGDQFTAVGQGFGSSPANILFGSSVLSSFAGWSDGQILANVPVVGTGKHLVRVKIGTETSNPVAYTVKSKSSSGSPTINVIDPGSGPREEYVTLTGSNFGFSVGTVRFKNAVTGDEALADTAFPAACADGYWKETSVIVKVPLQFLAAGAVTPGDYAVRLIRSDGAVSNEVNFSVTSGQAKPGICAISPSAGPIGTPVSLVGERFTGTTGAITFQSNISGVADSWTNTEVKTKVPTGAITGAVRLTAGAISSNAMNFQVRNCNEEAGICGQNEQCCGNGTCIAKSQVCAAVTQRAMFAWKTSTGLIPVAPRVVEECRPQDAQPPIPSPAPWDKRSGGTQACVTATVTMRFTGKLEPTTITAANFRLKKCTSASTEPCSTTQDVPVKAGFPLLQPASQVQDAIFLEPATAFDPDSTYLVEVLTGVRGFGPGGTNMDEMRSCGSGVGYCFRFKTRSSTAPCAVGAVSVAPHPYELNNAGAEVSYLASPLSSDDQCVVLQCDAYDWEWQNGDAGMPDGRAIFAQPLQPGVLPNSLSCRQTGVAVSETGNVPVHMNATVKPDGVKGTADLYVKFIPPRVVDHAPSCDLACINALVSATFNVEIDPQSLAGNIEIRPCANENCIESELGNPLSIADQGQQLGIVPNTSETAKRFLAIQPVDGNGTLLLVPGTYYRVLLRGGTETGIRGVNGVPMTGLNHPDGYVWTFRTKVGDQAFCTAQAVHVTPGEKYETREGARQLFTAVPFGRPDECSAQGQMLVLTEDASWSTSDANVADFVAGGMIDTGGQLPAQCSAMCLAMGSQGVAGKVASCGNGVIETTDAAYCQTYNATYGGTTCTVLPAGARNAEQCDPGVPSNVGLCDAATCLWKPSAQVGQGQGACGNGTIELGEMCDFGSFCSGSTAMSDMTSCTSAADRATCVSGGGTCAPRAYRGCTAFCKHAGSSAGNSTCGNADIADGEDCDDGNTSSADGCSSACLHTGSKAGVVSVCGNAVLEPGETCEKNAASDPTFPVGCDAQRCLHTGTSLCDNDPNTPNINCCSNGTIDAGEDCDDGNADAGDGCGLTCALEGSSASYADPSFCSDGILEAGEQCEVGLPSNHASLLSGSKNAAPSYPPAIGTASGDGLVDSAQLAYIVGNGTPDQKGLMSSTLQATVLGKTGDATYGLRCGLTSEASCDAGYGLTDQGCCSARPEITQSYPASGSTNVCRNVQISVTFNAPMNQASVAQNVQIAAQETGQACPQGTMQVTDDFQPVKKGVVAWLSRLWKRTVAFVTGNPTYAAIWCTGSVAGRLVPVPGTPTTFTFDLNTALAQKTTYRVKFLGDDSTTPNPLSDNQTVANKKGIKTAKGVVAPYDGSSEAGPLTWTFTTGGDICSVNVVQITDTDETHPLLFVKQNETHGFVATAQSLQNGVLVPVSSVAEYDWAWDPWTSSDESVLRLASPNDGASTVSGVAQNKNGNTFIVAWLHITADSISPVSTVGTTLQGTAPVTVQLCENPWPSLSGPGPIAPFRDKQPTGSGDDSSLVGTIFENGPYFNFSTTYCRDAGATGTDDDVPNLQINAVPPTSIDSAEGILRQYLFTYGSDHPELQKDGIGIRVAANPLHLSPEDWYAWRGFGGSPKPIMVDGYRALKDGTTTYVAAANTQNVGQSIYSNIYIISHNPDAAPVTVQIYEQMVSSLAFNINLTTEVSNICVEGNDPTGYGTGPLRVDGATHACSSDADCLKYSNDTHCASFKLKLSRDTVRLSDYQKMSRDIEGYRAKNGTYPKLDSGTYLQGFSTTRWNSWSEELSKAIGTALPKDPVNTFLTCGRCSQSQAVCTSDAECPSGQTCQAQSSNGATYDPSTCWDVSKRQYLCPKIGVSPSRVYQYRALNGGTRYELASEFEIPKPIVSGAKWWSPELATEVKRCQNTEAYGFLCTMDADCRSCPNPQDPVSCPIAQFPIPNGACRPANGRFVYSESCPGVPYGQGGTCGDGAIGSVCVGGAHDGNGCSSAADCPGGSCSGTEVCEIGQTRIADCKTDPNLSQPDGLKVQTCNECKEFVDDVNITKCDAGVRCGNGRVDRRCVGGTRNGLACLAATDCPASPGGVPGVCGPTTEVCDDGAQNGTYGHCNLTCTGYASYCGDGLLSPGETCDNGAQNGAYCSGSCATSCGVDCKSKAPYCGDGIVDAPQEQCDGQTMTTQLGICTAGTAIDQPCANDAACGTGGVCATVGALASCQGVTQRKCATTLKLCLNANVTYAGAAFTPGGHTICQEDTDCSGGTVCRSVQDAVVDCTDNAQCSVAGISGTCESYPTAHIRACSSSGADACTYPVNQGTNSSWSSCKALNFCGDGIINAPAEQCDDGSKNGDTKACTSTCKKNVCGDGKPYLNVEECDNGTQNGSITCNADYGSNCASCSTQCKFLITSGGYCGDQVRNGGEQCDGMTDVTNIADQYATCPGPGRPSQVCPFINADCIQSPCRKTKETGVTCASLGYDFATNGVRPKLKLLLDPATTNLDDTFVNPVCPGLTGMKYYEWLMYKECLGATCFNPSTQSYEQLSRAVTDGKQSLKPGTLKYQLAAIDSSTPGSQPQNGILSFANPLPSTNQFWACVKQKGPALGVGIETDGQPELVQCGTSCGFTGCGMCSDEVGTGVISATIVDAVYNQVVPTAKVSLYYKGTLVTQTSTDENGLFTLTGLNERTECGQYKLVIDKYTDNPCTGNAGNRPNCGLPSAPDWTYSYNVDEDARGGYWPLTTATFSVENFLERIGSQGSSRIYLFPRPGVGEAYVTVLWNRDWSSNDSIWGGYNNHVVVPSSYAYTAPNSTQKNSPNYPQDFSPTTCDYTNRPAANNQCVRDVTWTLPGFADLTKLPNANLICLHAAGDKVGGFNDPYWNGCPVEGRNKCIQAHGGQNPNGMCTKGIQTGGICQGGTNNGNACAQPGNNSDCPGGGSCTVPCDREWWDTCKFYKEGPLTTYFRYSAYTGNSPVQLYWGYWQKSIHSVLNGNSGNLSSHLTTNGYRAVISTDAQLVDVNAANASSCSNAKDCKFWSIGEVNPTTGGIVVKNALASGRPDGIATYEYSFQGTNMGSYCIANGTWYRSCSTNADCSAIPGASCVPYDSAEYPAWSQANY